MEPSEETKDDHGIKTKLNQDETNILIDLSNVPLEVLEAILSFLTDPVSQRRLAQVCKLWRVTVLRLRWLSLLTFERKLHLRLPIAGSFHEVTNSVFSLLLCVDSPVLLAGTAVFLPYKDNVKNDVCGFIQLIRHGTPHQGPVGEEIITHQFHVSRDQARDWQNDCHGLTQSCMQGPMNESDPNHQGGTFGARCKGLHPLPVMFHCVLELEPGVRYLLNLKMVEKNDGYIVSEEVGTVWGYNGVPKNRRKKEEHQNHFRWFQVYRQNMNSSISCGQFPIIYYIA